MSRVPIRHGGVVKCDLVHVHEVRGNLVFDPLCDETFTTYSMASLCRKQAANVGWVRVFVRKVKWPGDPPSAGAKKVDLCPAHANLANAAMGPRKKKVVEGPKVDEGNFKALKRSWREIFAMAAFETLASPDLLAIARSRHRERIKAAHPDVGGSHELAAELNDAMAEAEKELTA